MQKKIFPQLEHLVRLFFWFIACIFVGITVYQLVNRPCCDTAGYQNIAEHFGKGRFFEHFVDMNKRTYLYSLVLAPFTVIARYLPIASASFYMGLFQFFVFIGVGRFIKKQFAQAAPLATQAVWAGLAFNIFLFPYLSLTMTEGLSGSLTYLLFVLCILGLNETGPNAFRYGFAIVFLASCLLMIRPANIYLIPTVLLFCYYLFCRQAREKELGQHFKNAGILIGLGGLPILPQILQNIIVYDKFAIFSSFNLREAQIQWGKEMIKYGTLMVDGGKQLIYPNPFYFANAENLELGISWYFEYPLKGFLTALGHIFATLDVDLLFPYSYDPTPWYRWPVAFLGHSFVLALLVSIPLMIRGRIKIFYDQKINLKIAFLILVTFISWAATIAVTAPEVRFGLPIFLMAGPFFCFIVQNVSILREVNRFEKSLALSYILVAISYGILFDLQKSAYLEQIGYK